MEPKFRTSFIPKKTILAAAGAKKPQASPFGIVSLIALIIVLGAVALSVGVFLYQQVLISSINTKKQTLERARAAFEPELIEELVRLDNRIESAETILNEHIAPTSLFVILEDLTLKSVRFESFDFVRISKGKISISMKGVAKNFSGIALQADIFGKNRMIKEPIFSDLNINQEGNAIFNFSAFVDPALISYVNQSSINQVDSGNSNPSGTGL